MPLMAMYSGSSVATIHLTGLAPGKINAFFTVWESLLKKFDVDECVLILAKADLYLASEA